MTPIEFLYHLNKLPPESKLNLVQMGAMFEMLSGVLAVELGSDTEISRTARLTDQQAFSDWLGVPHSTVDTWRFTQGTGNSHMYCLGSILKWIHAHLTPLLSESTKEIDTLTIDSELISTCWKNQIAAVVINDTLVGFFLSLESEIEPVDYELFDSQPLSLEPARMTRDQLSGMLEAIKKHGDFSTIIASSLDEARTIYEECKKNTPPEVQLQFFYTALLHDYAFAKEISKSLEPGLVAKHFNASNWLLEIRINTIFCKAISQIQNAFELLYELHADLNRFTSMKKKKTLEHHVTVSHLMADCKGETFHLKSMEECGNKYMSLMVTLFDQGINYRNANKDGLTAIGIAEDIEEMYGKGSSLFKTSLDRYSLHQRLVKSLAPR